MTSASEQPETRSETVMDDEPTRILGGSVRILDLESFRDDRGVLTPMTFDDFGFSAARAFVVRAPQGAVRGGHGHRRVRQVLFCASGMIDLDLRHRGAHARFTLDEGNPAVLLEAGVWSRQMYVASGSTLIVFADGPYDSAEYVSGDEATS